MHVDVVDENPSLKKTNESLQHATKYNLDINFDESTSQPKHMNISIPLLEYLEPGHSVIKLHPADQSTQRHKSSLE